MNPMSKHPPMSKIFAAWAVAMILFLGAAIPACTPSPTPTEAPAEAAMPSPEQSLPYAHFIIGETTESEIYDYFEREPNQLTNLEIDRWKIQMACYITDNEILPDCFALDSEGVLQFLRAYLPEDAEGIYQAVMNDFGPAEYETYSAFAESTRMMIYGEEGFSFLVNPAIDGGSVVAFERFEPMTVDQYLATWGQNLPEENPFIR